MNTTLARLAAALGALLFAGSALAAGAELQLDKWPAERARNLAALQNGARLFSNYCIGCHSASLVRWNSLQQIGLDDRQIKDFLIPGRPEGRRHDPDRGRARAPEGMVRQDAAGPVGHHPRAHVVRLRRHRLPVHAAARLLP